MLICRSLEPPNRGSINVSSVPYLTEVLSLYKAGEFHSILVEAGSPLCCYSIITHDFVKIKLLQKDLVEAITLGYMQTQWFVEVLPAQQGNMF
jgi:hypothetical protein